MPKAAWNERIELFAGLLQNGATACLGVGLIAPLATSLQNPGSITGLPLAGLLLWALAVVVLHVGAPIVLGRLKD